MAEQPETIETSWDGKETCLSSTPRGLSGSAASSGNNCGKFKYIYLLVCIAGKETDWFAHNDAQRSARCWFQLMTLVGGHRSERIVRGSAHRSTKATLRLGAQLHQVLQSRGREAD